MVRVLAVADSDSDSHDELLVIDSLEHLDPELRPRAATTVRLVENGGQRLGDHQVVGRVDLDSSESVGGDRCGRPKKRCLATRKPATSTT